MDPKANTMPDGAIHSPASSGPMPSTSCRYWVMNRNEPSTMNRPSMFVASAALNAGVENRRTSISGSASRRSRRKKITPTARPTKIDTIGSSAHPSSARRLMP